MSSKPRPVKAASETKKIRSRLRRRKRGGRRKYKKKSEDEAQRMKEEQGYNEEDKVLGTKDYDVGRRRDEERF